MSAESAWLRSSVALAMEERIRADRHDVDAWRVLLAEAGSQSPAEFRPVFEAAVTAMPLCAPVWMRWVEAELRACEADQVEAIFELCLLRCPQLPLWQLFLNFVKGVKVVGLDAAAARAQLLPALELLLEAVGADPAAGPLWQEFVGLTAASELGAEANETLVSSSELSATRKAYQSAVCSCAAGLENLAREYEAWEARVSGPQAKLMMQDTPEKGMAARNVAQQRLVLYAPLRAAAGCAHGHLPSGIASPKRLTAFRQLWAFEAANPQRLDPAKLLGRMRFALSQGVGALWRAPQLWHEAATWFAAQGHEQVAREVWTQAIELLPAQPFLYLGLSSFEERNQRLPDASTLLDRMVSAAPSAAAHVARLRFAWRIKGRNAGRQAFAEARRAPRGVCSWHVYAAAAQLEYMLGDDLAAAAETARRILSLALSKEEAHGAAHATAVDAGLIFAMASFLASCADLPNLREHLERALILLPHPPHIGRLWDMYTRIEAQFGTASSQAAISERRAAAAAAHLPDASSSTVLASQHAVAAAHAATRAAAAAAAGTPLPGSLAALALDHSYEGISPDGTMELLAVEAAAAGAAGVVPQPQGPGMTGGALAPRGHAVLPLHKISRPSLLACIEYTGVEHRQMEGRPACAAATGGAAPGGAAATGASRAGSVPIPPEIATWLAALPPAGTLAGTPPLTAAAVEALCAELLALPQSIGKAVPRPAGGRGGAGWASHGAGGSITAEWGGVPVPGVAAGVGGAAGAAACRGRDIYSARASMHQAEQPLRPPGAGY